MFQFILAFVRAMILQPHMKVEAMMLKLFELRSAVARAQNHNDDLTAIVEFFGATSPWDDNIHRIYELIDDLEKSNYGQYTGLIAQLNRLAVIIRNSGRGADRINLSHKGEKVTDDNVFLGDIFGVQTFNVQYWRTRQDAPKGCWTTTGGRKLNPYNIVCDQARRYIEKKAETLSLTIGEIAKALDDIEEPKAELAQTR